MEGDQELRWIRTRIMCERRTLGDEKQGGWAREWGVG